jgi:hypothetical protein
VRNMKVLSLVAMVGCGGAEEFGSSSAALLPNGGLQTPSVALCALEDLTFERSGDTFTFYEATNSLGTKAHVAANRDLYLGQDTHVGGHAVAGRNLTVATGVKIDRSAVYGGTASINRRSTITQGSSMRASQPCDASLDIDSYFAAAALENNNAALAANPLLAPYLVGGGLVLPDSARITMPAGVYYFTHISLGRNAIVEIKNRDEVYMFVTGAVQLSPGVELETHPNQQVLWIVSNSAMPIDLPSGSVAAARIVAPRAEVRFLSRARVLGAVLARSIRVAGSGRVRFVGAETDAVPGATP